MNKEDYKIAYENVMIANKMLEKENKQLKETNEKLNNVLDNIGYLIEGLIYHTDNKSTISKHNEKVLRSMLEKIDKRNVSILGGKENEELRLKERPYIDKITKLQSENRVLKIQNTKLKKKVGNYEY